MLAHNTGFAITAGWLEGASIVPRGNGRVADAVKSESTVPCTSRRLPEGCRPWGPRVPLSEAVLSSRPPDDAPQRES